jgi:hypothetical protein
MEQKLTCANHSDEEIVLDQIGWTRFRCPKCGSDYSIGRKVIVLKPNTVQRIVGVTRQDKTSSEIKITHD